MTPSISKKTQDYLTQLEISETNRVNEPMPYYGQMDSLDKQIYEEGLRIKKLLIDRDLNVIILLLNTGKVIQGDLSDFFELNKISETELGEYENDGLSIFWPKLDVDLSLKGFLESGFILSSYAKRAA